MTWVKDDKGLDWPCVWSSRPVHSLQRKLSSSFPACCGEHAFLDRVLQFSNVAVTLSMPGSVPGQTLQPVLCVSVIPRWGISRAESLETLAYSNILQLATSAVYKKSQCFPKSWQNPQALLRPGELTFISKITLRQRNMLVGCVWIILTSVQALEQFPAAIDKILRTRLLANKKESCTLFV